MSAVPGPRVVKAGEFRGQAGALAFNFEDIRQRCDEHVERVRAQSKAMLEQAAAEAGRLREAALDEGRAAGRTEGLRDADRQIDQRANELAERRVAERLGTVLPALESLAESLDRERQQWLLDWETAAVELCLAVARKILDAELAHRPDLSRTAMARALELATGSPRLQVRLNPADVERLGPNGDEIVRRLSACREVSIAADESIPAGGCIVETDAGRIDATINTQLKRIADELLQRE